MTFEEALKAIKDGKKVKCRRLGEKISYVDDIEYNPFFCYPWVANVIIDVKTDKVHLDRSCICDNNWEIVEEEPKNELQTDNINWKKRAEYWQKEFEKQREHYLNAENALERCGGRIELLKETIQGKDQRIHFLLGQIESYEKILFHLPWLVTDETGGD